MKKYIALLLSLTLCAMLFAAIGCAPHNSGEEAQESSAPSAQESPVAMFHELPNGWQLSDFTVAGFDKDGPGDFGYRTTLDEGQQSQLAALLSVESWKELINPIQYGLTVSLDVADEDIERFLTVLEGGEFGTVIILSGQSAEEKAMYTAPAKVAEEAKGLAEELKEQSGKPPADPARGEPTSLESVPREQLAKAEPVAVSAGFDIYLRDENGTFIVPLSYESPLYYDQGRKTGDVIAARPGEDGCILGRYDTEEDQWGTLSPLGDGLVCFNNYHELTFIDTDSWTDTGFALDFQTPSEPNCRISSVARNRDTGEFAVIYQVSSYTVSPDGEERPWLAYDNSDIGAQDAHMEFQRFDSEGKFLERIVTDREPRGMNDVADCLPNRYRDGKITFLQKDYMGFLVTCDLATGETSVLDCESAFLTDGAELLYDYEYRDDLPGAQFTYRWYEQGKEVASLTLEEEQDTLTMAFEHMPEPLQLTSIDPEARTAELTYQGLIFHRLDFTAGTIELAYEYPEEQLGEPVLTGPDGRYQVYQLSTFSGGEARYEEMVAKDTQTGEFIRLGSLNNVTAIAFAGNSQFVVTYYDRMEACDLSTGEWYFPLNEYAGGENIQRKAIDVAYDTENRLILLLSTRHVEHPGHIPDELKEPILLEVYREDWTPVRTIDTGILPPHSQVFGVISPGVQLEQPGRLLLGEDNAVVEYLD